MSNQRVHQKHPKLQKPRMGQWGRSEYALLGTTCGEIQALAKKLADHIANLNIAYIDESHTQEVATSEFYIQSTKQGDQWNHETDGCTNSYQRKLHFNASDIQLVNGNHFTADRQIVFLDDRKKESLQRKLDRITNLKVIVKLHEDQEIYSFLKPFMKTDTIALMQGDVEGLSNYIINERSHNQQLNGLILAGGKSTRMGTDKGTINYHGTNQVDHLSSLLEPFCDTVFVSLRAEQESVYEVPVIEDSYHGFGPMSGILSAFKHNPNAAWITLAADLPFITTESIQTLIDARDERKIASCYIQSGSQFPDPLFTIWEPKAYITLLKFMSLGYACPRKVLINSDVQIIPIQDDQILMNVNDPATMKKAKSLLQ